MLALTYHRSPSKGTPWDHRMNDVLAATAKANGMLAKRICPSAVLSHLEAGGYSFYVAQAALIEAKRAMEPVGDDARIFTLTERRMPMVTQQPSFTAYTVVKREGQDDFWLNIGAAWMHQDGEGFNVILQALPIDGKIVLRPPKAQGEQPQEAPKPAKTREKAGGK